MLIFICVEFQVSVFINVLITRCAEQDYFHLQRMRLRIRKVLFVLSENTDLKLAELASRLLEDGESTVKHGNHCRWQPRGQIKGQTTSGSLLMLASLAEREA